MQESKHTQLLIGHNILGECRALKASVSTEQLYDSIAVVFTIECYTVFLLGC